MHSMRQNVSKTKNALKLALFDCLFSFHSILYKTKVIKIESDNINEGSE